MNESQEILIAKFIGTRPEIPRYLSIHRKLQNKQEELYHLPEYLLDSLQGPDGRLPFMMDQDGLDTIPL